MYVLNATAGCVGVDLDLQQALREHDELVLPPHRLGVGVGVVRDEDAVVEPEAGELDHHVRERGVAREEDAAADAEASKLPSVASNGSAAGPRSEDEFLCN